MPANSALLHPQNASNESLSDGLTIGNAASARKAAIRLCELRYVYSFRGEYRFSSMFFKAWLLRRDY